MEAPSLHTLLTDIGLAAHASTFEAEAVDYDTLLELDDAATEALLGILGLKLGEVARLKNRLKIARTGADPRSPHSPRQPAPEPAAADFSELASDEAALADITFQDFIAKGASGSVYKAVWHGMRCAVKRFNPCEHDPELVDAFNKEVFLLKNLNHENLVRFYGACTRPESLCIITELMVGSLAELMYGKAKGNLPDRQWNDKRKLSVVSDVVNGVGYLHSRRVAHRDLKSHNVLFDKDLRIKLCDMGFSTFKAKNEQSIRFESRVGTPAWMAPEVLNGEQYNMAADIWSLGVIVWEMVNRDEPWRGINPFAITLKVGGKGETLDTSSVAGTWWHTLMNLCWARAPDRPTSDELKLAVKRTRHAVAKGQSIADGAGLPWEGRPDTSPVPPPVIAAPGAAAPAVPAAANQGVVPPPETQAADVEASPYLPRTQQRRRQPTGETATAPELESEPEPEPEPQPQPELEPEIAPPTIEVPAQANSGTADGVRHHEEQERGAAVQAEEEDEEGDAGRSGYVQVPDQASRMSLMPRFRHSQVEGGAVVSVCIPSTVTRGPATKSYTDFVVEVTTAAGTVTTIHKRFSEFLALRKELGAADKGGSRADFIAKVPFPAKQSTRDTLDVRVVQLRQRELEAWLVAVLRNFDRSPEGDTTSGPSRLLFNDFLGVPRQRSSAESDADAMGGGGGADPEDPLHRVLAHVFCTPAADLVESEGSILQGELLKEGKLNKSFQPRYFVLWQDPAGDGGGGEEGAERPMLLCWFADKDAPTPKQVVPLIAGMFTVGVPKRVRRGQKHCLRIDGIHPHSGLPFKYVLSAPSISEIRNWRHALATRGGEADSGGPNGSCYDGEGESVEVDRIEVVQARRIPPEEWPGMAPPSHDSASAAVAAARETTTVRGAMGRPSPTASLGRRGSMIGSPMVMMKELAQRTTEMLSPRTTAAAGGGGTLDGGGGGGVGDIRASGGALQAINEVDMIEFVVQCYIEEEEELGHRGTVMTSTAVDCTLTKRFADFSELRDRLVATSKGALERDHMFPSARWGSRVDDRMLETWREQLQAWLNAVLHVCATEKSLARFMATDHTARAGLMKELQEASRGAVTCKKCGLGMEYDEVSDHVCRTTPLAAAAAAAVATE